MIAFLCQTLEMGHHDAPSHCTVLHWRDRDRGECEYMGEAMPFRLVTHEEQLRCLELRGIVCIGRVPPEMVELALTRVRSRAR